MWEQVGEVLLELRLITRLLVRQVVVVIFIIKVQLVQELLKEEGSSIKKTN